jgi:DNA invertase Pin-like site-specific DNA recombinase
MAPSTIPQAVAYARVSTKDQGAGTSIPEQLQVLKQTIEQMGYQLAATFTDEFTGRTFKRKGWQQLLTYCKANKKMVKVVFIKNYSRYGRNMLDGLMNEFMLNQQGIKLTALDTPLDDNNPYSNLMKYIQMGSAEAENLKRGKDVKDGMRQQATQGKWPQRAPLGYTNLRNENGTAYIAHNTQPTPVKPVGSEPITIAQAVINAFELVANTGVAEHARHYLKSLGIERHPSKVKAMLSNRLYIGKIPFGGHEYEGKHQPLISDTLFGKVQQMLAGKSPKGITKRDDFYLKGWVTDTQGNVLTASYSTGKSGLKVPYYHSTTVAIKQGNNERINANKLEVQIQTILDGIRIEDEAMDMFFDLFRYHYETQLLQVHSGAQHAKKQIAELTERATAIKEDYLIHGRLSANAYEDGINYINSKIHDLQQQVKPLPTFDAKVYQTSTYSWLKQLGNIYRESAPTLRYDMVCSIFPNKLTIRQNQLSNPQLNQFIVMISKPVKDFSHIINKGELTIGVNSPSVARRGIIIEHLFAISKLSSRYLAA